MRDHPLKSYPWLDGSWKLVNASIGDIHYHCTITNRAEEIRNIYAMLGLAFVDVEKDGIIHKVIDPESLPIFDAALAFSNDPEAPAKRALAELQKQGEWDAVYSKIGVELIADKGLSPEAMIIMTYVDGLSDGYHYLVVDGLLVGHIYPQRLTAKKRHFYIDVEVDKRVTWYARPDQESFRLENVPDTIIPNLPGRPLSDLISHPVIDRYAFTIDYIIQAEGGWLVYLRQTDQH